MCSFWDGGTGRRDSVAGLAYMLHLQENRTALQLSRKSCGTLNISNRLKRLKQTSTGYHLEVEDRCPVNVLRTQHTHPVC